MSFNPLACLNKQKSKKKINNNNSHIYLERQKIVIIVVVAISIRSFRFTFLPKKINSVSLPFAVCVFFLFLHLYVVCNLFLVLHSFSYGRIHKQFLFCYCCCLTTKMRTMNIWYEMHQEDPNEIKTIYDYSGL